jgi:putative redox protein
MSRTITAHTIKNYQVEVNARQHRFVADEPESKGGDDCGPNPYDLLLASLAACKIITVHMYAQRKGWPVERVNIHMSHQKSDAADCDDCTSESGKIDEIYCDISFEGDLDDDQRQRLAEIANRCPVHRTLTSETKIRTILQND